MTHSGKRAPVSQTNALVTSSRGLRITVGRYGSIQGRREALTVGYGLSKRMVESKCILTDQYAPWCRQEA